MLRPAAVLAWALAALLAGAVVWWGVAVVGSDPGVARDGVLSASQVRADLAAASAGPSLEPSTTPSATPSPAAPSEPAAPATAQPDPSASATPTADASGGSPSTGAPTVPGGDPTTSPPPAATGPDPAAAVARTWDVEGGQVAAACTDGQISLQYATPDDGWSFEIEGAGPEELEVKFRRGDTRSIVHASCVAGIPEMSLEQKGDSSGSSEGPG